MASPQYTATGASGNPDPREVAFIDKEIDKLLKEAKRAAKMFDGIHAKLKPVKIKAGMGNISHVIYNRNPIPQSNFLASLPPEIQRMVWSYLVLPADRISFGLTCKSYAQVFQELKPTYQKIALKHYLREHRLAVLVRMSKWVPASYRLCFTCVRFIKNLKTSDWGGNAKFRYEQLSVRDGKVMKHAMIQGPKCLGCRRRDGIDMNGIKQSVKDMRALLKKNLGTPD